MANNSDGSALGKHPRQVLAHLYPDVEISVDETAGTVTGSATFYPQPEYEGAPGWMHGGLSATVLDFVSAKIANASLTARVATGTLDLRYRQPVTMDGGPYQVQGSAPIAKDRTVRVNAEIVDHNGRPLVEASGLFVAVER